MNLISVINYMRPFSRYRYTGAVVPCPVCGDQECGQIAGYDRRFKALPTVACHSCGMVFTNPMPTEAELTSYYQTYYRLDYQLASSGPKPRHIAKRQAEARLRAERVQHLLPPGGRTLDFGAGSGEFVSHMLDAGFDAHGFEPGASYASHAIQRLGGRFRDSTWQAASYDEGFDLVTCFHVLEHLGRPLPALRRMVEWLRPGGKVYIEVPDTERFLKLKGTGALHFAHVLGFTRPTLLLAAAQAGLRPLRIEEPTGIIFEQGPTADPAALAREGREMMQGILAAGSPSRTYWRYRLGKLGIGGRRA